jgi:hypothetical protein
MPVNRRVTAGLRHCSSATSRRRDFSRPRRHSQCRPLEPPPGGPPAPGTPGTIGWHELQAGDLNSAFAFYSGLLGWTKSDAIDMGPMGTYQIFNIDDVQAGGMMTKTPQTPRPFWLYYINVEAIDAVASMTGLAKRLGTIDLRQRLRPKPRYFITGARIGQDREPECRRRPRYCGDLFGDELGLQQKS